MIRFGKCNSNNKPKDKKSDWPVISARIPQVLRNRLEVEYPNRGQISELILKLLQEHVGK